MRSHVSNVASAGYLEHVTTGQLVELAGSCRLVYVENLGGGSLVDLEEKGLPWCPTLKQAVAGGADLVLASGDKIIGGPQAGIIVGKQELVRRLSQHHLARVCRCSKLTLGAMEATLAVYLTGRAWNEMPTLRLLGMSDDTLHRRAAELANACNAIDRLRATIQKDTTECGGAVLPGVYLTTWTVRLEHHNFTEDELRGELLAHGVVARRGRGTVILDLRSVLPQDNSLLLNSVRSTCLGQAGRHRIKTPPPHHSPPLSVTMYMPIADFTADIIRPSELDTATIEAWHAMMKETTFLQRGFFTPEFTIACGRAHDLAGLLSFAINKFQLHFFRSSSRAAGTE